MKIVNNKYTILEKIGEGSFGSIYKGQNIRTNEHVAIKIEPIKDCLKLIKNESIVYQFLNNTSGIPHIKWYGKDTENYYMVINLLGDSLQSFKEKNKNLSLKIVLQIGIKIIQLLQIIHEKGLVHRDIKPHNFLFGNQYQTDIYIIDFGFCKSYLYTKERKTKSLIGSISYASINAHNLIELTRRDDLESVGYMLSYFYLDKLPWQTIAQLNLTNSEFHSQIIDMKLKILEDSNNIPVVLQKYIRYVRNLKFEERPNYSMIINDFLREIEK